MLKCVGVKFNLFGIVPYCCAKSKVDCEMSTDMAVFTHERKLENFQRIQIFFIVKYICAYKEFVGGLKGCFHAITIHTCR